MIPKKIHYCWFGCSEKPDNVINIINNWKEKCPDYELIEWNESNCDLNINSFVREAYNRKKWAYVSDYFRLKALHDFGGIYLDTDVEIIKSFNDLLKCKGFIGFENKENICTAILGAEINSIWIDQLLTIYDEKHFIKKDNSLDLTPNVKIITSFLNEKYNLIPNGKKQVLDNQIVAFPVEYFSPKDFYTGEISITKNTYTIHYFDASWMSKKDLTQVKRENYLINKLGMLGKIISKVIKLFENHGFKVPIYLFRRFICQLKEKI